MNCVYCGEKLMPFDFPEEGCCQACFHIPVAIYEGQSRFKINAWTWLATNRMGCGGHCPGRYSCAPHSCAYTLRRRRHGRTVIPVSRHETI